MCMYLLNPQESKAAGEITKKNEIINESQSIIDLLQK